MLGSLSAFSVQKAWRLQGGQGTNGNSHGHHGFPYEQTQSQGRPETFPPECGKC